MNFKVDLDSCVVNVIVSKCGIRRNILWLIDIFLYKCKEYKNRNLIFSV